LITDGGGNPTRTVIASVAASARNATRLNWSVAAVIAMLTVGRLWSVDAGLLNLGITILVNQFDPSSGGLELVPSYIPGSYQPGAVLHGYQVSARVFLIPALLISTALAFGFALGRRWPRIAVAGFAGAFVLALSARQGDLVLMLGAALLLVGQPAFLDLRSWIRRVGA
jgi:hypothetical protein